MAAREEDKAMAGLLRRSLAQDAGAGSGENCPEPEILAAYFDHALDADETARYDLHFSRCSVCREQLAAMVRAGGVNDADAAEKKDAGAWAWLTGPGWLMPAAAMLFALLAITGIALRMRKPGTPANEVAIARPDAAPLADTVPPTNSAPSPEAAPPSGAALSAPAITDKLDVRPPAPSESRASREVGAPSPPRVVEGAHPAMGRGELSRVGVVGGSAGKSAAAPVKQPQGQKPAAQSSSAMVRGAMRAGNGAGVGNGTGGGAAGGIAHTTDETATVTEAAPPVDAAEPSKVVPEKKEEADSAKSDASGSVETETTPQPNARKSKKTTAAPSAAPASGVSARNPAASNAPEAAALAKMQQAQISSNLMNLQIHTPDPKILWMIAGAGAIEKSEDGGATWKLEYLDAHAPILAGAAPSAKICWLVGENGTIQRTTNGAHWKTIKPPEETDFVRVEAEDASNVTVTALDGRRFSTSDGGKNWNSVK
jgi:hypothetical protein